MTQSNHIVLGYDYNITPNLRIKAETYYQWLNDVPVTSYVSSFSQLNQGANFGPSNQDFLVNNGTGDNYGIELTAERFFNRGWYFLATGSLFQSKYVGSDGVERNTAFNTQHALNVLAGHEIPIGKKKNQYLAYNLRVSWVGGRYLTPIDLEASKQAGQAVFDEANAFSEKQDPYFRTDIRIAYRWEMKSSTMEFAVDLQNITNHKNVFAQQYDPVSQTITTEYQQGFFPVPTFRVTF
jgi:outer membrane receptor protein involved in Fe transport